MKECSKSIPRRLADPNFTRTYFVGSGLDVGGKPDPLALYRELFFRIQSIRTWDLEDGDAQFLHGVGDETLDFVHSSHCLEHLDDPRIGLSNWFRVLKPDGYLVVTVPDEDLYEQGVFPSSFNLNHRWTFTLMKGNSWSKRSLNILDLLRSLGPAADPMRIELLSATYRFELPRYDQTLTPIGECGIEFVVRKRRPAELQAGGRLRDQPQPAEELRRHLNQYKDDLMTLKRNNELGAPFQNDSFL